MWPKDFGAPPIDVEKALMDRDEIRPGVKLLFPSGIVREVIAVLDSEAVLENLTGKQIGSRRREHIEYLAEWSGCAKIV